MPKTRGLLKAEATTLNFELHYGFQYSSFLRLSYDWSHLYTQLAAGPDRRSFVPFPCPSILLGCKRLLHGLDTADSACLWLWTDRNPMSCFTQVHYIRIPFVNSRLQQIYRNGSERVKIRHFCRRNSCGQLHYSGVRVRLSRMTNIHVLKYQQRFSAGSPALGSAPPTRTAAVGSPLVPMLKCTI